MGRSFGRMIGEDEIVFGQSRTAFSAPYKTVTSLDGVTDDYDVMIDFSSNENAKPTILYSISRKKPLVMGTTALSEEDEALLEELSKIAPVLYSHNTSLLFNKYLKILEYAAALLEEGNDIEIVERHDRNKKDAPSGTSSLVIKALERGRASVFDIKNGRKGLSKKRQNEIGLHSVRGGTLGSEHHVSIFGLDEEIALNHVAISYDVYASGALWAARRLMDMAPGLYDMKDLIG